MTTDIAEAVYSAATAGDITALEKLISSYGAAAVRADHDPGELTALHWAAAAGNLDAVRFLLAPPVSADATAPRINNFTPLHSAAMQGHAAVCKLLIDAGSPVNAQTAPQGYAPLHSAAFAGHIEAIEVLLKHGADVTLRNYRNERPADTALRTGQSEAARMLAPNHPRPRIGQLWRNLARRICGSSKANS
jgi:ankyrin repeat protein